MAHDSPRDNQLPHVYLKKVIKLVHLNVDDIKIYSNTNLFLQLMMVYMVLNRV